MQISNLVRCSDFHRFYDTLKSDFKDPGHVIAAKTNTGNVSKNSRTTGKIGETLECCRDARMGHIPHMYIFHDLVNYKITYYDIKIKSKKVSSHN